MDEEFVKLCYESFKENDKKFPDWTLDDYEKYAEECNRILEKEGLNEILNENITEDDVKSE